MTKTNNGLVEKVKGPVDKKSILCRKYRQYCAKKISNENFDPTGAIGIKICSDILTYGGIGSYSDIGELVRDMEDPQGNTNSNLESRTSNYEYLPSNSRKNDNLPLRKTYFNRGKRDIKDILRIYQEGSVLNKNSYCSDTARKLNYLIKNFPHKFGENGIQPLSSEDPIDVGRVFYGVITHYEKKLKNAGFLKN